MPAKKKEETPKIDARWIYLGRRFSDNKSKTFYVWAPVDNVKDEKWYSKNLVSSSICSPGAIYDMKISADGDNTTVFTGGENAPKFVQMIANEEKRLEWSMLDRTAYQQQRVVRRIKDANKHDPLKENLDAIREHYRFMSGSERSSFLGWMIWYVTRGV